MALEAKKNRRTSDEKNRVLNEVQKEDMKRLNVDIPTSLHTRLKMRAVREGTTIRELAKQMLLTYLESMKD
jgi:predicted HicB family RNase H-like nuclease